MNKIYVINVGKHNPGYKDRKSIWLKFHFSCYNDHGFQRLCEIDQMRFINFIRIQIITKSGIPIDNSYLTSQGFDLKERRLKSTLRQLEESKLIEIREETEQEQTENRVRTDGEQTKNRNRTEQEQEVGSIDNKPLRLKSVTQRRVEKKRKEKIIYVRDKPPTREEVLKHISKRDYMVDGSHFYDKYTEDGWLNANGKPIISWRGTLVTWHNNAKKQIENDLPRNHPDSPYASH